MKATALCVSFALVATIGRPLAAQGVDKSLGEGVRMVEEGEFDTAINMLDTVVKQLSSDKKRPKDLSRAYLYLAIAYLGLSKEASAKARFIDAIANDPQMNLSPREFPPKIIQSFEEARKQAASAGQARRVTKQGPYFDAVKRGDFNTVRELLKEEPALVAEKDPAFGATGLHWAALKDHEAIVGLLLAQGAEPGATNNSGETAFQVAARAGHVKVADLLKGPEDALVEAAKANDVSRAKQIVEANGALLNRRDPQFGATPLHWAALKGNNEVAEYLVSAGADLNAKNNKGETPYQVADRAGKKNMLSVLAGGGGATGAPAGEIGIFEAAKRGDLARVQQLVRGDSTLLGQKDAAFGATPLHWAALRGHTDVVAFLLSAGADTEATNGRGETPIQVAQRAGKKDVVEAFKQRSR